MLDTPHRRPENRVFLVVGYLLVAGVVLRLLDNFSDMGRDGWVIMALLALYLVVLTVNPFVPLTFKWHGHAYLALQTVIVTASMLLAHHLDYFACLFFPLSTQALLYYPRRAGRVWIVVFSVIFMSIIGFFQSVSLALFYGVASVFFASYGALMVQAVAAQRQLEDYAARVEDLTLSNERQRLARELHDTLAQGLAGLILQLEAADTHLARGSVERAQTIVKQAMTRARVTLSEARRAISDLRAADAATTDLPQAVREEAERFTAATGLACELDLQRLPALPDPLREHAFRAIAESLTNVARHAGAQHVWVHLADREGVLEIRVRDDGVGFSPAAANLASGHYGLIGLRERARLAGGSLEVTSAPGQGTTVALRLPLAEPVYA